MAKTTTRRARETRGKLLRTELITVRLEPQVRFWVDLACRLQRRTVSHFVEDLIKRGLKDIMVRESASALPTFAQQNLWHPVEADRFVKVALRLPECLSYDEQILWTFIWECEPLWQRERAHRRDLEPSVQEQLFDFALLRAYWDDFQAAAQERDPERLPPELYPRRRLEETSTRAEPAPSIAQRNGVLDAEVR
jgi:hypothetical protein